MTASRLKSLLLVAALVFSQALYAGHGVQHDRNTLPHCQICLQASGCAALACGSSTAEIATYPHARPQRHHLPVALAAHPNAHPSRAPPPAPL